MSFKQLYGYETVQDAYHCAEILKAEGIECVLRHRGKGLFGDAVTDEFTWIDVPEADFDRAKHLLFPEVEDPGLMLELQCPRCRSLRVKFDIVSHKRGLGKIFTWPWDKERFFCEECEHVWDREPEAQSSAERPGAPTAPSGNSGITEGPPSAS
jgi:hypothetical protein